MFHSIVAEGQEVADVARPWLVGAAFCGAAVAETPCATTGPQAINPKTKVRTEGQEMYKSRPLREIPDYFINSELMSIRCRRMGRLRDIGYARVNNRGRALVESYDFKYLKLDDF